MRKYLLGKCDAKMMYLAGEMTRGDGMSGGKRVASSLKDWEQLPPERFQ